ncbi:MAG: LLM class flavin-dependent oxidoreductase [Candidatus Limnocylindrales bacterium]|nr:LLM class flavin-dependent oxidoreductase [Candidatus Limnocylindrales bacterium]
MRLGIGLPTYLGNEIEPGGVLDWARRAEAAGFDAVAVHDRPHADTWDPIATLAAVAAVTERVRLATAVVLLPTRDEALLVKQAAVVDAVSGGRLDLGVGVGGRINDFELYGRPFAGRGREFERQLGRIDELWRGAVETAQAGTSLGPAPIQRPRPRLWVGGYAAASTDRAVRFGDGYIFGAVGIDTMTRRTPAITAAAAAAGRSDFPVAGLAYLLSSTDAAEIDEAERLLTRYYGSLHKPFRELVSIGDDEAIAGMIGAYRAAGLDVLHLIPVARSADQIDRIARVVGAALA